MWWLGLGGSTNPLLQPYSLKMKLHTHTPKKKKTRINLCIRSQSKCCPRYSSAGLKIMGTPFVSSPPPCTFSWWTNVTILSQHKAICHLISAIFFLLIYVTAFVNPSVIPTLSLAYAQMAPLYDKDNKNWKTYIFYFYFYFINKTMVPKSKFSLAFQFQSLT